MSTILHCVSETCLILSLSNVNLIRNINIKETNIPFVILILNIYPWTVMSPVLRCLSEEEGLEGALETAGGGERGGSDIDSAAGRWLNGEKLRGDRGLCCILLSTSWRRAGAISGGFSITVIRPVRRRRGESGNDGGTRPLPPK